MRNAKIVCTLGPSSDDRQTIAELAAAGMSVARLNASHGEPSDREKIYDRIRSVDQEMATPVATMLDLGGPEVRTADHDEAIELTAGSTVRIVQGDEASAEVLGVTVPLTGVTEGDRILIDDGKVEAVAIDRDGEAVIARINTDGVIEGRRSVNLPGVDLELEPVTDRDRTDLEMAVKQDIDLVAASFVRDGTDVLAVNETIESLGGSIPVIAKIERSAAVDNLESIVETAYGVMVARGDLGVECPMEDVPIIQKRIIRLCHREGVPVITATEMLDSMIHARRPTRAEASDVANAVLDGTDAVMLSGETAIGDHPVLVVETMARIVDEVESSEEYRERREQWIPETGQSKTEAIAKAARFLARDVNASAVVIVTESGYTALKAAKFKPAVPIVAATPTESVGRQLALSWGVTAKNVPFTERRVDAIIEDAVAAASNAGVVSGGETVVVLCGMVTGLERASTTNMMKVHIAAETLGFGTGVVVGRATGPVYQCDTGDLSEIPAGAVVSLPMDFDTEFVGEIEKIGAIIDARRGMTGYPAMVAREIGIPMVGGVSFDKIADGTVVTVDGERGVIYEGRIEGTDEST